MTDTMQALPKDAPVMVAWNAYNGTDDYRNTRNWALHEAHVDGSLWAAFLAGHEACFAIAQKRVNELEERVRTLEFHVAQRGAACAPFAEACSNCIDDEPDNGSTWEHPVSMEVTFRDFRDARDVLDLPSAALPTPEVPGESEEEMK